MTSCNKIVEPSRFGDFYYINETNHVITFDYNPIGSPKVNMVKYSIPAKSTVMVKQTQESNITATELDFYAPFMVEYGFVEPLIIKFDNTKCLNVTLNSLHSPLDIKNYVAEKLGERKYKFIFTFSEEDYTRASNCP